MVEELNLVPDFDPFFFDFFFLIFTVPCYKNERNKNFMPKKKTHTHIERIQHS